MTITIDATYEGGVLKPDGPLPLSEHEKVRVTVEPQGKRGGAGRTTDSSPDSEGLSALERIVVRARSLPPEALAALPDDLASQHDHYLYGTPKRPE